MMHSAEEAYSNPVLHITEPGTYSIENEFSAGSGMTRAMLMTVLARLDGINTDGGSVWYEKGMDWAVNNNISDGSNPGGDVNREQIVTMLYRYAGEPAVTAEPVQDYPDASSVSPYALSAFNWAIYNGIINGMEDGTLASSGNASRAQVSAMLERFIKATVC